MSSAVILTQPILEATTALYTFTLVNEFDEGVPMGVLGTLIMTYYDLVSGALINGRHDQNVLNANDVTVTEVVGPPLVTTVTWVIQPADSVIVDDRLELEQHVALFRWSWYSGTHFSAHEVQFGIEALTYVP